METILEILGVIFISIGAAFLLLGSIGILRMPDVYSRLQAGTKASTLGTLGMLLGIGFFEPAWFLKIFIIMIFVILSNPISSHSIARGSCRSGIKPKLKETVNAYRDAMESCEESIKKDDK
ncbi:MAG: monovalent cation/H(+) antiporter subunit G [Bacteroidales bacterium]|nr:monovalent cation/H(+) antiporter subunit G [Bacteroidales bacterium]